jgi:hypothetical protein
VTAPTSRTLVPPTPRKGAQFFRADVQVDDLRGPYDAAYSRFGMQFFASPVAALRNV